MMARSKAVLAIQNEANAAAGLLRNLSAAARLDDGDCVHRGLAPEDCRTCTARRALARLRAIVAVDDAFCYDDDDPFGEDDGGLPLDDSESNYRGLAAWGRPFRRSVSVPPNEYL